MYPSLSWYRGDMFSFAATIPDELLLHRDWNRRRCKGPFAAGDRSGIRTTVTWHRDAQRGPPDSRDTGLPFAHRPDVSPNSFTFQNHGVCPVVVASVFRQQLS